ncbi:tRNA uridine-5-carboxymethylaminomethyl(34) synthesis GTPase MnmE [Kiloniella sp. EL199]|uniref:tRNA uridine-5-carboxymethylaminomethyl(34) synthesis GTPase MnmE n=1 Tax=Kiloniella sp. EL199 TaxID=2107581 RepID=UPI000EA1CEF6|nr:tRNA uridine-5-carboxymethylaminomethyl(34) synthesis GTPase MnmE [Kiloniella sp. EL199]
MASDTIFALSTAPGQAGVAVIRISGSNAKAVLEKMSSSFPEPRVAALIKLFDPEDKAELDRCLALWFPGPASFTGEDVVELHLHGGRAVVDGTIEALAKLPNFRPAEAGEFTRRAFDNDKLDLTEVEGLSDLIAAETEAQRKQAIRQMDGELSNLVEGWRDRLVRMLAYMEAEIDFPDEELEEGISDQVKHNIEQLKKDIKHHLDDSHRGERLRNGIKIAIVGPPNAGKSSLLNALARREVAIVSDVAGTTRDIIEVHLDLSGYPVIVSDTAGLREIEENTTDGIELEGIRRAKLHAESADLCLAVFDIEDRDNLDQETLKLLDSDNSFIAINKCDKTEENLSDTIFVPGFDVTSISTKSGEGIGILLEKLNTWVVANMGLSGSSSGITRQRHRSALQECLDSLDRSLLTDLPELCAEDLRLATRYLGRITGKVDVEELLDVIFRDFCIGK